MVVVTGDTGTDMETTGTEPIRAAARGSVTGVGTMATKSGSKSRH